MAKHLHPDPWPESQRPPTTGGRRSATAHGRRARTDIVADAMPGRHYVIGSGRRLMQGEPSGRARHRASGMLPCPVIPMLDIPPLEVPAPRSSRLHASMATIDPALSALLRERGVR